MIYAVVIVLLLALAVTGFILSSPNVSDPPEPAGDMMRSRRAAFLEYAEDEEYRPHELALIWERIQHGRRKG